MAGARVVPGLRTFLRAIIKRFEHDDAERWIKLFQHRSKRGAHDAGADQDDVRRAGNGGLGHLTLLWLERDHARSRRLSRSICLFDRVIQTCGDPAFGHHALGLPRHSNKWNADAGCQDHVSPPPGLLISQSPAMTAAGRILREQNIAGVNREVLARAGLKVERSTQRYNELPGWRIMPGKRTAGSCFLKGDADNTGFAAQQVATCAIGKIDRSFLETGIAIPGGPYAHASNDPLLPLLLQVDSVFAIPTTLLTMWSQTRLELTTT